MVIFIISIIVFNVVAYKMNQHLTKNQVVHIWMFTMVLEIIFDIFVEQKWNGYWFFTKGIGWRNIIAYILLVPPVNIIFLNRFPFKGAWAKKIWFFVLFVVCILGYEALTLFPQPWGFFHYGWWHWYYSLILDPILLSILLLYFKWIQKIERQS